MVRCASCDSEVLEGSRFCSSCGAPASSDSFATRTVAIAAMAVRTTSAASQGRFTPGQLLGGRYRIVAMLGKGGMGEVYRADDLTLDQPVALKFLPEALAGNAAALTRFRGEVRIARQVSHPNVCRVYDVGEVAGQYFLSMEYVDGEDLGSLLRRIGRLPADKAIEIARKLCAGLAAAHEKGVLHRDLKPSNVMLDGRGQVLLTDFGLAALASGIEGAEARNGTPAYMAPEQLAGEEVTVKSDIYALGLVLYEIFTGRLPYESTTLAGLMRAQRESTPVSPTTLVRDLDPAVERVILRCIQARPAQRPASALAVAAALPGGDPLAAALAAGETPSPEMVAAAGEGEGLSVRVAVPFLAAILVGIAAACVLTNRTNGLEMLRPEYSSEVMAQKARDVVQKLAPDVSRPADEASGFAWDDGPLSELKKNKPRWSEVFAQKPPVLHFWYRRHQAPLTAISFHNDLLTPGMVDRSDPPPIDSGMIQLKMDSFGRLLYFERIPAQKQESAKEAAPQVDWNPLFHAAGLDQVQWELAEPLWTSLAASDTRAAWTGAKQATRIEAGALRGQPVFFSVIESWTKPDRTPQSGESKGVLITLAILGLLFLIVCTGAYTLARRNLAQQRGDRRGAWRLAAFMFCVHILLWLTQGHLGASFGTFATFLLALCTSVFYGVLIWTFYIALEPYVRRRWPRTLISWSSVLIGRLRDPVVGRDVLIGVAMGVAVVLIGVGLNAWLLRLGDKTPGLPDADVLAGLRSAIGLGLAGVSRAIRGTLFFFFILFLLRELLRNQWAGAVAFAALFSSMSFLTESHALLRGAADFVLFLAFSVVVMRYGLLCLAVGTLVKEMLVIAPVTTNTSAWYFSNGVLMVGGVVALAVWAFRTSLGERKLLRP